MANSRYNYVTEEATEPLLRGEFHPNILEAPISDRNPTVTRKDLKYALLRDIHFSQLLWREFLPATLYQEMTSTDTPTAEDYFFLEAIAPKLIQ